MSSERRRSPRIEILGRLHGKVVSLNTTVTVREISLGGLSLESPFQFPAGAAHEFSLTLGDGSSVVLRGVIRYSRPEHSADGVPYFVTGVQFIEEDPPPGPPTVGDLIDKIK